MKFKIFFAWFDFWVGFYYDIGHRTLYFCPLPTIVLRFEFKGNKDESKHRKDRHPNDTVTGWMPGTFD